MAAIVVDLRYYKLVVEDALGAKLYTRELEFLKGCVLGQREEYSTSNWVLIHKKVQCRLSIESQDVDSRKWALFTYNCSRKLERSSEKVPRHICGII
jgi:hypothetical protein